MSDVSNISENKQKIVEDMKLVVADAEEILKASAGVAGEKIANLRARISERLDDAKERIADAEAVIIEKAKAAAYATDDYVQENPWQAVGLAAAVGLLVGIIVGRR